MHHPRNNDNDDALFAEATYWHFRLQAEDVTPAERAACSAWIASGAAHEQAWSEVQNLLGALHEPARQLHAGEPRRSVRKRRTALARWASAAVLVLAVALGFSQTPWYDRLGADYVTSIGELRLVELADGSRLHLNTDSAVQVDLADGERQVWLMRGEVWFDVANDHDRPFVVHSADGWARVRSTRFSMARLDGETRIKAADGQVDVSSGDGAPPVSLKAGESVRYQGQYLAAIETFDRHTDFAWLQRQLVFRQQPLAKVVAELNRYWPGHIFIVDEALRTHVVSGVFEIDKPEAVFKALEHTLGLRVERYTSYLQLLRERTVSS
ncbi:FecR family protein [Azomonas macrocytogenes]|uniref:Transmembrane sensor n=1 Tax=Azomonas macrocytogenes TaxID=69962 RepID=A0A839T387_AZOMA|nr:FecR family protein [Azomonas macrocytogenes]MBB3103469.1 transmembrane sensor [Azomonas macrocytogenes]